MQLVHEALMTDTITTKIEESGIVTVAAADLTFRPNESSRVTTERTFDVRVPIEDSSDFVIEVRSSVLAKTRAILNSSLKTSASKQELYLSGSTLFIGFFVSSFFTKIENETFKYFFSFTISPVIGFCLLVAYFFARKENTSNLNLISTEILALLPNPDEAQPRTTK
jgi:hypothetical protein